MKIGDLVVYESDVTISRQFWADDYARSGIIVAELASDGILARAVSVLWTSGELVERVPPRILEVISESR
jgi:hypothetical protein